MLFVLYFLVFYNSLVTPGLGRLQISPNPGQVAIMNVQHSGPYVHSVAYVTYKRQNLCVSRDRVWQFGQVFFNGMYLMVIFPN